MSTEALGIMIRTLIVIDVAFYREGLQDLLTKSGQVTVVGVASGVDDAERIGRDQRPDVVLLDVSALDSTEGLRRLRAIRPAPKIIALAIKETPESFMAWAESGVSGYVPRQASLEDLLRVLKGAVSDELYCSPRIAAVMLRRLASLAEATQPSSTNLDSLSPREQEVISLVARGLSNKAIASELGIANATAKNHVHNILDKLALRRRVELASLLQRARL
jgi:two-component system, NarL family, nitrate/nitrite response regulator NarL